MKQVFAATRSSRKSNGRKINLCICLVLFVPWIAGTKVLAQGFREIHTQSGLSGSFNNNGVSVADYDRDGDLDLFVVSRWKSGNGAATSQLYQNNNDGTFTNVTVESGINSTHDYTGEYIIGFSGFGERMGASWGDYDNDGFPDLFLSNVYYFELYHNNGNGTFTDVTAEANLPLTNSCYITGATWFDFNNDSYLDLYVTKLYSCSEKFFYKNNGDGSFSEYSENVGLTGSGSASWMAVPWDINKDGFQDLYIVTDFDLPNQLYINDSGTFFIDSAEFYGLKDINKEGMGFTLGDYNNDELLDFYITTIDENSLFKNLGNNVYADVAVGLGVDTTKWSWGTQFFDYDNDLDLDLVVVNGYNIKYRNAFFENTLESGIEGFFNRATEFGMDELSSSNGVVTFDYDNDGDLDFLIGRTGDHLELFENQLDLDPSGSKNWVQLSLEGTTSNRDAIGTLIKVRVGDTVLTRYYNGLALMAQNLQPVHFGLADVENIDQLTIKWPSGIKEEYTNLPVNSFLKFTEGSSYDTLDLTSNKISGCMDPNSCNYNPAATQDDGGCGYLKSKSITGGINVEVLNEADYSYPETSGHTYDWSVTNGVILEGQGTASIKVEWDIADKGTVTVTEMGNCSSLPVTLEVNLSGQLALESKSIARLWNEALLAAIRKDYARPTVHARNLFHASVAMYDAWALFNESATPYLIGKQLYNYNNQFNGFESEVDDSTAMSTAISFAAYRLLTHRFKNSPNQAVTQQRFDDLMTLLGLDKSFKSTNYSSGDPAALGNFIGQSLIEYGFIDRANETSGYANQYYQPRNEPLVPVLPGNPNIIDPNHWQPLTLDVFIDQAGNVVEGKTPSFLSPEWGVVYPFSLSKADASTFSRDGGEYVVYHDPGPPPSHRQQKIAAGEMDLYKWNFLLVSMWSSHLDPYDGVMWEVSPIGIGNIDFDQLPTSIVNHSEFYDLERGGDIGKGRSVNPITSQPYISQMVPRGDYTRVLAEFWADGPDSETPPGHWFVILNYVTDHPQFIRKFKGEGEIVDLLEWDVKAYFTLGGTMHDAAIVAWGVKGWYDFIRPISAIRYMAEYGQSTDITLSNYHQNGIPLVPGFVEVVKSGDSLAGVGNENLGKIKLYAWRGHEYVQDPNVDEAGVGWILAENWWPYQRPSFVTPPFAGYVSGHSTYSRAAAEVMTLLTGSEYFPGGMGEFVAKKNEFLVFEEGPSQDVHLQWATYRDASDQCSLSRIWGGIHPPADDIPGRILGHEIGIEAFVMAESYFNNYTLSNELMEDVVVYPVPTRDSRIYIRNVSEDQSFKVFDVQGHEMSVIEKGYDTFSRTMTLRLDEEMPNGLYILQSGSERWKILIR
ncbi:FG-GAP-like repeat-containing protein [Marinoscillum sp. MHG1-6]|uniref:FG-GAP-like repeat-containing protein n=1 Tax=Marinoscillum sp. MHG1-6 TaxID=2959627 RepID=UPI0021578C53|nr:FG-GAP-like repeat-containing protein [Marinoscillum sp. MHG1-6]